MKDGLEGAHPFIPLPSPGKSIEHVLLLRPFARFRGKDAMMIQQQQLHDSPSITRRTFCPVQTPPGDWHEVRLPLRGRICHPSWTLAPNHVAKPYLWQASTLSNEPPYSLTPIYPALRHRPPSCNIFFRYSQATIDTTRLLAGKKGNAIRRFRPRSSPSGHKSIKLAHARHLVS